MIGGETGRGAEPWAKRSAPAGPKGEPHDPTERKGIRARVGLLELARQLGSVTQACRLLGKTPMQTFLDSRSLAREKQRIGEAA